jgi:hypothetical protein
MKTTRTFEVFAPITFCILALCGTPANILAQPSADSLQSIEQQILSHEETDLAVLGKARAVLWESIKAADTAKARAVLGFMATRFDNSKITVLYPVEEVWLAFWLRDYELLFARVAADTAVRFSRAVKLWPTEDLLLVNIEEASRAALPRLQDGIRTADLPSYKRDFLLLLLDYVAAPRGMNYEERDAYQQKLNKAADEYLAQYKDSEFNAYVRGRISVVIVTSDWGLGIEGALGYLALPGSLSRTMKDFGILTMTFEATYKKAYAGIRLDLALPHNMRKGFEYKGTWKDDLLMSEIGAFLALGPVITPGNGFVFTPHAGVGVINFSPPEKEKNIPGNDVSMTFATLGIGSNFDIPLGGENTLYLLRVYAGQRWAVTNIPIAKGGYTFITMGLLFFEKKEYVEQ